MEPRTRRSVDPASFKPQNSKKLKKLALFFDGILNQNLSLFFDGTPKMERLKEPLA